MRRFDPLRVLIAIATLVGGIVHFKLWNDGYQDIDKIGPSFLLNAIASAVAAVLVVVWPTRLSLLLPLGIANATLVAFALSRTDNGFLDFQEFGWEPSPEAVIALVAEIATAVLCVVALARASRLEADDDPTRRTL